MSIYTTIRDMIYGHPKATTPVTEASTISNSIDSVVDSNSSMLAMQSDQVARKRTVQELRHLLQEKLDTHVRNSDIVRSRPYKHLLASMDAKEAAMHHLRKWEADYVSDAAKSKAKGEKHWAHHDVDYMRCISQSVRAEKQDEKKSARDSAAVVYDALFEKNYMTTWFLKSQKIELSYFMCNLDTYGMRRVVDSRPRHSFADRLAALRKADASSPILKKLDDRTMTRAEYKHFMQYSGLRIIPERFTGFEKLHMPELYQYVYERRGGQGSCVG